MSRKFKFHTFHILYRLFAYLSDRSGGWRVFVGPKLLLGSLIVTLGWTAADKASAQNHSTTAKSSKDLLANKKDTTGQVIEENVFCYVTEQMPQFPGGDTTLLDFVYKNLKYPESAIKEKKEGKVILRFVVTKTGELDKIKVFRSLQHDCDNEAVRVVKMLPKFIPGIQNGEPKSFWYTLPVTFKLPTIDHTDVILNQKFEPDHIFDVVEQMPEFPGSISALLSFIDKNITKSPLAGGLNYKVFCRMVIEKDGSVSNITVIKSVDSECDKEAVRVLKLLPKFIPAKYNGQNVRAYYIIPVSFENK